MKQAKVYRMVMDKHICPYGLKTVDILVALGERRMVGGQEDMIVDVALDILKQQEQSA